MNIPNKKLGFGLMRLPLTDVNDGKSIDKLQVREMIDYFMNQGFTYFDTAYVYHGGMSEEVFGELVAKRYPRDKFTVTSKMPMFIIKDQSDYQRIFDEQLKRCQVEYFDYYFLHALNINTYLEKVQRDDAFGFLLKQKELGKIKHIGFSFHDKAAVLDRILTEHPEVELVQLQINYIDWDSPVESKLCYEVCMKHHKKVAVMEPLKGGKLVNVPKDAKEVLVNANPELSLASWGIRYCASLDNVIVVLSGMSNMEQVVDNTSFMKDFKPLTNEEQKSITKVVDIIKEAIQIPCTNCKYCTPGCPMKIAIPSYFNLLNDASQYGLNHYHLVNYQKLKDTNGAPTDCIECGQCNSVCPQHLDVIEGLKKVVKMFEK